MEIKDLAGISDPLKRLVEVIAEGVGAVSKPYLVKKNAEAKAYEIRVISQAMAESRLLLAGTEYEDGKLKILPSSQKEPTESLSLPERSESRQTYQEFRKQQNIETICANSAQELSDDSKVPENKPESDWINRFFEIAGHVSTEDLQLIWGKILAGEIREPGSFSLRALETLKNMSRQEAEIFQKLCQYILYDGNFNFYIGFEEFISKKSVLTFVDIVGLKDTGLVSDSFVNLNFVITPANRSYWEYGSQAIVFEREKYIQTFQPQVNKLTRVGSELLKLVNIEPDMEYLEYVARQFHSPELIIAYAPILERHNGTIKMGNKTYLTQPT